jgi:hypothetical protein
MFVIITAALWPQRRAVSSLNEERVLTSNRVTGHSGSSRSH